jgi:hypothetical protein
MTDVYLRREARLWVGEFKVITKRRLVREFKVQIIKELIGWINVIVLCDE